MRTIWYVIADSSHATVYSASRFGAPLVRAHDIDHPEGRLRAHELVTDRQGSSGSDFGPRRAFAPSTDPVDVELKGFAREIARYLDDARRQNSFAAFALAMPPRLLGMVKEALPTELKALLVVAIDERLVDKGTPEISARFSEAWRPAL